MVARSPRHAAGPGLYIGWQGRRLWRIPIAALALGCALAAGGCSFSYRMDSLLAKKDEPRAEVATTGSIDAGKSAGGSTATPGNLPPDMDLAYAKAAASDVLSRGGDDASLPWENPHSGARGTVTPIAAAYEREGFTCRDFLASYVHGATESWMQGAACRVHQGRWEVRDLKPWRQS